MSMTNKFARLILLGGLAGCAAPPVPPSQIPFVAVPGPTKTQAQFQQDDTTCRVAAVQLPPAPAPARAATGSTPAQPAAAEPPPVPPGISYLRCMEVRNNLIEPLAPVPQVVYAYYPDYPVFYRSGYPWFYPEYGFGFGYGYGFYGGRFGGYRGGYWNGYREGSWHGGFHGGFHGGGGGHGGGFGHR